MTATNTPAPASDKSITTLAAEKIAAELAAFQGDRKATAVSRFVASALTHFCEENEQFAEVVRRTPRTLSDCCAEVMAGSGAAISDIDVYRGAVKSYFPNAEVVFKMEIHITGDAPTEEEVHRQPEKPIAAVPRRAPRPAPAPRVAAKEALKVPKPEIIQLSLF